MIVLNMSEYQDLKVLIENTDRKVDRLLNWAEGDSKLGTPSIKDQIDGNRVEVEEAKKKIQINQDEILKIKMKAGGWGLAGGAFLTGLSKVIEAFM